MCGNSERHYILCPHAAALRCFGATLPRKDFTLQILAPCYEMSMDKEHWVRIRSAAGMTEAQLIKGRLEANGIAVRLQYDATGTIFAITIDGLGEVQILVPEETVSQARETLERFFDEADLPWDDPRGETDV